MHVTGVMNENMCMLVTTGFETKQQSSKIKKYNNAIFLFFFSSTAIMAIVSALACQQTIQAVV